MTHQLLFSVAEVTVSGTVDSAVVIVSVGNSRVLGGGGGRMWNEPSDCYA